ncbi:hypothetical protein OESDEN_06246 [Oesophagostomum dentatum]|uniref:N-acetyltransferase domain-containing protein n=1 Tax=Oesophagostomum dentatum TaxID=61180 RepID=A0A0B1TCJ3_OESDE|nr:hypothetical protein OESDEN_06246 [Oesophagostomum dentatum]
MTSHLRFETATKEHVKDVKEFMLADFGTTEPITQTLKATPADLCDFYDDFVKLGCSHEKYSTLVYEKDKLVAMCLNSVKKFNKGDGVVPEMDVAGHDFAEDISKGPYKQHKANQISVYLTALEHRERQLLGNDCKVFYLDILSVAKTIDGLARELTRRAVETARTEGCEWVVTSATAAASQGLFLKMGFQVLYEIPFSDFLENGNEVFRNTHDGCTSGKFMALAMKRLQNGK